MMSERVGNATVSARCEGPSRDGRRRPWVGEGVLGVGRMWEGGTLGEFADRMLDAIRPAQDAVAGQAPHAWPVSCLRRGLIFDHD